MTSPRLERLSPASSPAADSILSPVQGVGKRIAEIDLDILQDDIQQAPTRLQRWVGGLDDAAGTIAPPAAALGATVLAGQVANLAAALPRPAQGAGARRRGVPRRGGEQVRHRSDAEVKDDLAAAAKTGRRRGGRSSPASERRHKTKTPRNDLFPRYEIRGGDVEVSARTTRREEEEAAAGSRSIAV